MPKIDQGMESYKLGDGNFTFTGARIERLGASEYTLVTIAVDESGSVQGFENDLLDALKVAIDACKKSPRAENLLVRVLKFSSAVGGTEEIHGFKPLSEIDVSKYPDLTPGGMTPLFDAVYSAIGATNKYAHDLYAQDYDANAIFFVITDGWENASVATENMIKDEMSQSVRGEEVESLVSVLIGINADEARFDLESFKENAGFSHYIDAGDATKGNLAKLADFVSQSVSSQSQALGSGGPSQNISATI